MSECIGQFNKVQWFPQLGFNASIYGASVTKTFEVLLTGTSLEALRCVGSLGSVARPFVGVPFSLPLFSALEPTKPCQFTLHSVVTHPCTVPFAPTPGVEEQVYGFEGAGGILNDCAPGSAGCSVRFEGEFYMEWSVLPAFSLPSVNYVHSTNCHSGSKCIASGIATPGFGGILLRSPSAVIAQQVRVSHFEFWVRSDTNVTSIFFAFDDCAAVPLTPLDLTPSSWAWKRLLIPLGAYLSKCPSIASPKFVVQAGHSFVLDSVGFTCMLSPCGTASDLTSTFVGAGPTLQSSSGLRNVGKLLWAIKASLCSRQAMSSWAARCT